MGLLFLFLFLISRVSASLQCERGLGNVAIRQPTPGLQRAHLHREDLNTVWFFDTHLSRGIPLWIQTSDLDEFQLPARTRWAEDEVFRKNLAGKVSVWRAESSNRSSESVDFDAASPREESWPVEQFLSHYETKNDVLMYAEAGDAWNDDLHIADPNFWKFIPCYESIRNVASRFSRKIVMGSGGPQRTSLVAHPWDMLIYVAQGEREIVLYPPNAEDLQSTTFVGNANAFYSAVAKTSSAKVTILLQQGKEKQENYSSFILLLFFVSESGEFLFVPFLWWRETASYCRHVSVETYFDLRGILDWSHYKSGQRSVFQAFMELRAKIDRSTCPDLQTEEARSELKKRERKRLLYGMIAGGTLVMCVCLYVALTALSTEKKMKKKKDE